MSELAQRAIPTQQQRDTLRGLIRCGSPLTDEQRDHLARLLDEIGLTVQVCARATQRYPRCKEIQDAWLVACWEPVGDAYAELVAAVSPGLSTNDPDQGGTR